MKIIDAHVHLAQCIAGFGAEGELRACGGGKAVYASGNVINMLMCDQDSLHIFAGQIDCIQPILDALAADTSVDQHMAVIRPHTDTIAAASAGNTT